MWLQLRLYLLMALMFGIIYAVLVALIPPTSFIIYGLIAAIMMIIQYMIGPKMVEWGMGVKYVSEREEPELHKMVGELAYHAGIPKPKVGIARTPVPNAFAFGRWKSDGRVCVTEGIMGLLSRDELKAVLGHEISHLKHRDVAFITMLSVIPMILWYIAWSTMFSGGDNEERGGGAYIGIIAFILYFISNLLVMYGSRIREYYADRGSVELGNDPHRLASALYKLVYGSARASKENLKQVEGMKAFFANDPSRASAEIKDLAQLDLDRSGTIDRNELLILRNRPIKVGFADKMMELFSTHPNMLKRIQHLSSLQV